MAELAEDMAVTLNRVPRGQEPRWSMRYRVGAALARELEPVASFVEIAEYLGTTKQNAYTFTVLALGKLAFALRDRLAEPPR